jgi:leucyl-tRNA synthetase
VRAKIELPAEATAEVAREAALGHEAIQKWVDGKQVVKFIHVPKRIINIVVK